MMPHLEEVLQFLRASNVETRNLIIRELQATRRREDEMATKTFRVGEWVRFHYPDNPSQPLEGRIVKVGRSRVVLAVTSKDTGFLERVSVPASLVVRRT